VTPVLGTFVGLSATVLDSLASAVHVSFSGSGSCSAVGAAYDLLDPSVPQDGLRNGFLCITQRMHAVISNGLVFSIVNFPTDLGSGILDAAGTFVGSLLLALIFGLAILSMVFHLVEVVVRLAIAAVMFPVALVGAIFPVSRYIPKVAFRMVVYSGVYMFLIAIVFAMAALLMDLSLAQVAKGVGVDLASTDKDFWAAFDNGGKMHIGIQNAAFWWMAAGGALIIKMLGAVSGIADKFAEYGDGIGFGQGSRVAMMGVAGVGAVGAKGVKVGAHLGGGAAGLAGGGLGLAVRGLRSVYRRMQG
jgi:hypothetical protein